MSALEDMTYAEIKKMQRELEIRKRELEIRNESKKSKIRENAFGKLREIRQELINGKAAIPQSKRSQNRLTREELIEVLGIDLAEIRKKRIELQLTQKELAEILGVDPAIVCRLETGWKLAKAGWRPTPAQSAILQYILSMEPASL